MVNLFNGNFGSTTPDNLIADTRHPIDVKGVVVKGSQGKLQRGTVLGVIGVAPTASVEAGADNVGDGTISAVTVAKGAKAGVYTLVCIEEASDAGVFSVKGPGGVALPDATVGVAYNGPIQFTISDGAEDFDEGDTFAITVAAAQEEAYIVNSQNADNSAFADCILTDDIDTTDGDVVATAYTSGSFNRHALVFGGTDTALTHEATLRTKGIFLKDVQAYEE